MSEYITFHHKNKNDCQKNCKKIESNWSNLHSINGISSEQQTNCGHLKLCIPCANFHLLHSIINSQLLWENHFKNCIALNHCMNKAKDKTAIMLNLFLKLQRSHTNHIKWKNREQNSECRSLPMHVRHARVCVCTSFSVDLQLTILMRIPSVNTIQSHNLVVTIFLSHLKNPS